MDIPARLVHFRAASRAGRPDFGANRRRMTRLSTLIAARLAPGRA
jgi:uncharacterized protein (DUF1499 family)